MSILNHFGKVKTTYVPYTSKYPGNKVYHVVQAVEDGKQIPSTLSYCVVDDYKQRIHLPVDEETFKEYHRLIFTASDGLFERSKRTFILQDFADIIKRITDNFTSSIWKTLNTSPLLTIHELLWLKVDDVSGHVGHLEKMLISVIEENKLLQRKIDVLEKSLAKGRLEKMLLQVNEENKLLLSRIEILERKEILYELD